MRTRMLTLCIMMLILPISTVFAQSEPPVPLALPPDSDIPVGQIVCAADFQTESNWQAGSSDDEMLTWEPREEGLLITSQGEGYARYLPGTACTATDFYLEIAFTPDSCPVDNSTLLLNLRSDLAMTANPYDAAAYIVSIQCDGTYYTRYIDAEGSLSEVDFTGELQLTPDEQNVIGIALIQNEISWYQNGEQLSSYTMTDTAPVVEGQFALGAQRGLAVTVNSFTVWEISAEAEMEATEEAAFVPPGSSIGEQPEQESEATSEMTAEPEIEQTPEATPEATAEPEIEETPEATPEATAKPETEATLEATAEPEIEATPEATPEPEIEQTPEATAEPETEATLEATAEPEIEATPEATAEPEEEIMWELPAVAMDEKNPLESGTLGRNLVVAEFDEPGDPLPVSLGGEVKGYQVGSAIVSWVSEPIKTYYLAEPPESNYKAYAITVLFSPRTCKDDSAFGLALGTSENNFLAITLQCSGHFAVQLIQHGDPGTIILEQNLEPLEPFARSLPLTIVMANDRAYLYVSNDLLGVLDAPYLRDASIGLTWLNNIEVNIEGFVIVEILNP